MREELGGLSTPLCGSMTGFYLSLLCIRRFGVTRPASSAPFVSKGINCPWWAKPTPPRFGEVCPITLSESSEFMDVLCCYGCCAAPINEKAFAVCSVANML